MQTKNSLCSIRIQGPLHYTVKKIDYETLKIPYHRLYCNYELGQNSKDFNKHFSKVTQPPKPQYSFSLRGGSGGMA